MKLAFIQKFKEVAAAIRARFTQRATCQPGHCSNINALLLHLCDFDHALRDWILCWLALPLQKPGTKMVTAIVFNGGQGTGKSLFFDAVMAQVHGGHARVITAPQFLARLTMWAESATYVVIDGSTFTNSASARIKQFITSSHLAIHRRYAPRLTQENTLNMVFLSNAADFLPASHQNRRFVIVEAPPAMPSVFYRSIGAEIENGGIDAFREFLMSIDLTDFSASTPPPAKFTEAKLEAA
ncbi:MAG: primase-helicase family protein [Pseudomonadota bacterium]